MLKKKKKNLIGAHLGIAPGQLVQESNTLTTILQDQILGHPN